MFFKEYPLVGEFLIKDHNDKENSMTTPCKPIDRK